MTRLRSPIMASFCLVAFLSCPAFASSFADLNCDENVNITDVQLSIIAALGLPISQVLDADQDGTPDACPTEVSCGAGTVLDETGACVALVTQADMDAATATAFEEGAASVDITSDNQAAFDAGVASVPCPAGAFASMEDSGACEACSMLAGECADCECADFGPETQANCEQACTDPTAGMYTQAQLDAALTNATAGMYTQAQLDAAVDSVDITTDNQQSFDAGVDSVDITTDNQQSFDAGVDSVICPDLSDQIQASYDAGYDTACFQTGNVLDCSGVCGGSAVVGGDCYCEDHTDCAGTEEFCYSNLDGDSGCVAYQEDFCDVMPCFAGHGDCDIDTHCDGDLMCGTNNCDFEFNADADCCCADTDGDSQCDETQFCFGGVIDCAGDCNGNAVMVECASGQDSDGCCGGPDFCEGTTLQYYTGTWTGLNYVGGHCMMNSSCCEALSGEVIAYAGDWWCQGPPYWSYALVNFCQGSDVFSLMNGSP